MIYDLAWQNNFYREINQPEAQIDIAKAALHIAQSSYPFLDLVLYLQELEEIAEVVASKLPMDRYPLKVIKIINEYLFEDLGFQGNQEDYYNLDNSFLNRVLETRRGIPLTLSLVYLEVAKRLQFPMVGIGMPGHFLIRPDFPEAEIFVDAFNQGEILFPQDCEAKLQQIYGQQVNLEQRFLTPVSGKQMLARMLTNLKFIYLQSQDFNQAIATIGGILMLFPEQPRERRDRGLLYFHLGDWQEAEKELATYLNLEPDGKDVEQIRHLLSQINRFTR